MPKTNYGPDPILPGDSGEELPVLPERTEVVSTGSGEQPDLPDIRTKIDAPYGWNLPELTPEQTQWLDTWFSRNSLSAASSAPLICSDRCNYKESCPLSLLQTPMPIGRECPIERTLLKSYAETMQEALNVDADDPWSLSLIEYASLWKVIMRRALMETSRDKLVVESYRGVDKEGNALYESKIHPAVLLAERVNKILHEIGEDLIATKKAKAKLDKEPSSEGPDARLARIKDRMKEAEIEVTSRSKKIATISPNDN